MEPIAGESAGTSGIILRNSGRSAFAKTAVIPDFSATFNNPSHKQRIPVKFSEMVKAVFAEANVDEISCVQISPCPSTRLCHNAKTNATKKNETQIKFSISPFLSGRQATSKK